MPSTLNDHDDPIIDLPFPLECFPDDIAAWLEIAALQARVPVPFVAYPFLAFTGASLGNRIALQVGPGWTEHPGIWVALIAPTGHGKTPAIAAARAPFATIHDRAIARHQPPPSAPGSFTPPLSMADVTRHLDAIRQNLDTRLMANMAMASLPEQDPPPDPWSSHLAPVPDSLFISTIRHDTLTQALANATGRCLLRDELASLLLTIDRGRGDDRQALLSLWSSEPIYPPDPTRSPVLDPVLAIVGGFQSPLFPRLRTTSQDGLLERFLLINPDPQPNLRTDPNLPAPDLEPVIDRIRSLPPAHRVTVSLSLEAGLAWRAWFHRNTAEIDVAGCPLNGFYRKFPSHVSRLALILHALWQPSHLDSTLAETTIRHAIALAEYLRPHTRRVAAALGERGPAISRVTALAQRIQAILVIEPGWITRTQLLHRLGRPTTARFNDAIANLIETGAIAVSKEKVAGSDKPVTLYRQASHPAPNLDAP